MKHVRFAGFPKDFIFEDAGDGGGESPRMGGERPDTDPGRVRRRLRETRSRRRRRSKAKRNAAPPELTAGRRKRDQRTPEKTATSSSKVTHDSHHPSRGRPNKHAKRTAVEDARMLMELVQTGGSVELVLAEALVSRSNKHRLKVKKRFQDLFDLDPVEALTEKLGPDWHTLVDVLLQDLSGRTERCIQNPLPLTVLRLKSSLKYQTRDFVELLVSCSDSIMGAVRDAYKDVTRSDLLWEMEESCSLNPTVDVLLELVRKGDRVKVDRKNLYTSLSRVSPMGYELPPRLVKKYSSKEAWGSLSSPSISLGSQADSPSGRLHTQKGVKEEKSPSRGKVSLRERRASAKKASSRGSGGRGTRIQHPKVRDDAEVMEILPRIQRLAHLRYQPSRTLARELCSMDRLQLTPDFSEEVEVSFPSIFCNVTRRKDDEKESEGVPRLLSPSCKETKAQSRFEAEASVSVASVLSAEAKANPCFRRCKSATAGGRTDLRADDASQAVTPLADSVPRVSVSEGQPGRAGASRCEKKTRAQSAIELRNKIRALVTECQSMETAMQEARAKAAVESRQKTHSRQSDKSLGMRPRVSLRPNTAAAADTERKEVTTPVIRRGRTVSYAQKTVLQASAIYGGGDFLKAEGQAIRNRKPARAGPSPSRLKNASSPAARLPDGVFRRRRRVRWTKASESTIGVSRSVTRSAHSLSSRGSGPCSSLRKAERFKASAAKIRSISRSAQSPYLEGTRTPSGVGKTEGLRVCIEKSSPVSASARSPGVERVRTSSYSPFDRNSKTLQSHIERSKGTKFPVKNSMSLRKSTPRPKPGTATTSLAVEKLQEPKPLVDEGAAGGTPWLSKTRRNFRPDDLVRYRKFDGTSNLESTPTEQEASEGVTSASCSRKAAGAHEFSQSRPTSRNSLSPLSKTCTGSPPSGTGRSCGTALASSDVTKQSSPGRQHPDATNWTVRDVRVGGRVTLTTSDSSLDSLRSVEAGGLRLWNRKSAYGASGAQADRLDRDWSGGADTRRGSSSPGLAEAPRQGSDEDGSCGEEEQEEEGNEDPAQGRAVSRLSNSSTSTSSSSGSTSSASRRPWRYSSSSVGSDSGRSWTKDCSARTTDGSD